MHVLSSLQKLLTCYIQRESKLTYGTVVLLKCLSINEMAKSCGDTRYLGEINGIYKKEGNPEYRNWHYKDTNINGIRDTQRGYLKRLFFIRNVLSYLILSTLSWETGILQPRLLLFHRSTVEISWSGCLSWPRAMAQLGLIASQCISYRARPNL